VFGDIARVPLVQVNTANCNAVEARDTAYIHSTHVHHVVGEVDLGCVPLSPLDRVNPAFFLCIGGRFTCDITLSSLPLRTVQ
jgi:hypothetical protein